MDVSDDDERETSNNDDEACQPLNRRVVLPAYNTCPQISAFIPADVHKRGVVFIDLKSWRLALYPKSRNFCCIEERPKRCFALFFFRGTPKMCSLSHCCFCRGKENSLFPKTFRILLEDV